LRASLIAANAGIVAARDILAHESDRAFCCVRPPGHHAEKNNAMGFCFFNNVAVTGHYLLMNHFKKILIIDFDVHHGNGTQEIFYNDNRVLFVSTHQSNIFPFSGLDNQNGGVDAEGFNINISLPQGTRYAEMEAEIYKKAARQINLFDPDVILFSAGFDAHKEDPIGGFDLESEDFYKLSKLYLSFVKNTDIPVISILEGGYNSQALAESVECHIQALCEKER
jgi:acetoin utilization deacetylase AcuC-like enzyme